MSQPNRMRIPQDNECAIIGGVLVHPDSLAQIDWLEAAHFGYLPARLAFASIRNLAESNQPIDVVTVATEMGRATQMAREESGVDTRAQNFAFLGDCALRVPTPDNIVAYATEVRDAWLNRSVRLALGGVLESNETSGAELLSMALASISHLDGELPDEARTMFDVVRRRLRQLEQIAKDREEGRTTMSGAPTGVAELDRILGGWPFKIASIVCARPAMGKSSLGLATADAATEAGFGVHLFSLEDTEEAYADRGISRMSDVPASNLRNTQLNRVQMGDIGRALPKFRARPWLVDSRSGISAAEVVRSVRKHKKANRTRVVIVDYIQLLRRSKGLSTHEALTESITILADAAKQDDMAYVVLSQLNRDVEKRNDKRPLMSDLRESGSLEERSKCIVGIYRGHYYGPDPVEGIDYDRHEQRPTREEFARQVQLIVIKNNNGATGNVMATFDGPTTRIW